ncbi:MAG: DinB family protein [Chitinophagaceae bacterium]
MNKEIKNYISDFENIYKGEPWYGKPLMAIVKETEAQKVFKKPVAASHSVYEIAHHLLSWRDLLVKRLNGDTSSSIEVDSKEDWLPLPKTDPARHWDHLVKQLEQNQQELIRSLSKLADDALDKNFAGSAFSLRTFLNGQIQHDIYHIGQIALANKNNQLKNHDSKNMARTN